MKILTKQQRYDRLRSFGCVCCRQTGVYSDQVDMHHLVDKGTRKSSGGDRATVPLCVWHHRGITPNGWTEKQTSLILGPSLAGGKKPFVAHWGTERDLLAKVDAYLYAGKPRNTKPRSQESTPDDDCGDADVVDQDRPAAD